MEEGREGGREGCIEGNDKGERGNLPQRDDYRETRSIVMKGYWRWGEYTPASPRIGKTRLGVGGRALEARSELRSEKT